jgi:hypothetical protein
VCAFVPAMLAYHLVARGKAVLTGVARCGRCGAPAMDIEGGHCGRCEERERLRTQGGKGAAGLAGWTTIPWVRLLGCALLGTAVLSSITITLVEPPWGRVAFLLADVLNAWDPNTTPGENYGHYYPGLPVKSVKVLAYILVGPPMFAVLGALLMTLYHKLAFTWRPAPPGKPGLMCGWCGYQSGEASVCPECGRAGGDTGSKGDRPPGQRWLVRLRSYALAAVAFVIAIFTFMWLVEVFVYYVPVLRDVDHDVSEQIRVALVALPTFVAALVAYHFAARGTAWLNGLPRCGGCGFVVDAGAECGRCRAAVMAKRAGGGAHSDGSSG